MANVQQFRLSDSQRYLVNTNPDTNPTHPNGNSKR